MTNLCSICIYDESCALEQICVPAQHFWILDTSCNLVILYLFLMFHILRAAFAATSSLYDSIDDSLHRLVRVSNQRSHDLEALSRLSNLVDKLEKVLEIFLILWNLLL